ncbi:MAG: type II toxin-antitoxin system RelE/ParE family toxin [Gemmataceae bacterium]|nr:type II toxin-antitoxin system RelE/ParE family toxin [Gemmataceae bacterium]
MNPRFLRAALTELDDAVDAYEVRQPGLGADLRRKVQDAVATVLAHPAIGTRYGRTAVRQYILTRFPFSVVYRADPGTLWIIAVAHHKRRRGYWKRRVP